MSEAGSTDAVRERYQVPAALGLRVEPGQVLAWTAAGQGAVERVAADPDALSTAAAAGRAPLARLEDANGALLVRRYRKGGLLRHLRGRLFRGRWRPLDEFVLHRRLLDEGVPVPEAVGCVVVLRTLGWRGYLLVREVAHALDLEAWLHGLRGSIETPPSSVLRRAGRAVRLLHDAGVRHADLHPKNLLVTEAGEVLVLDLDRAQRFEAPLPDRRRIANLVRFGRSIEKHRLKGLRTGRREALRFLEGYAGSRDAATRLLERIRVRLGRGLALRMLWWRMSGEARPWRSDQERMGAGDAR